MTIARNCLFVAVALAVSYGAGCRPVEGPLGPEKVGQVWTVDEDDEPANPALLAKLNRRVPRFEFADVPLKDVIQYVRDWADINVYTNWATLNAAGIDETSPVNVKLKDVSLRTALDIVLEDVGAGQVELLHEARGDLLVVATREHLSTITVTRIYDVGDILDQLPDTQSVWVPGDDDPGGGLFSNASPGNRRIEQVSHDEKVAKLLTLIRSVIDHNSWYIDDELPGGLSEYAGKLVITHTRETHRLVGRLLAALREQTPTVPLLAPEAPAPAATPTTQPADF